MLKNATLSMMCAVCRKNDNHFFDTSTINFFNSIIHTNTNNYGLFVTSEQYDERAKRLYSIRFITENGKTFTVGKFQQFETKEIAIETMDKMTNTFNELKKCTLENEILIDITAIYEAYNYNNCIEVYNNNKGFIFNLDNFTVNEYITK